MLAKLKQPAFWVFVAIFVLVSGWIASGVLAPQAPKDDTQAPPALAQVSASWSEAQPISRKLFFYGDVQPVQVVTIRARAEGLVEEVVKLGTSVTKGDRLAQLSLDDRPVRLAQAKAHLASVQRDYEAISQLIERNLVSDSERQLKLAQLESARASLQAIELEIANTRLQAPVSGVVNRVLADLGSFVSIGGEVVEIIDNNPLIAVIHVQQADIARLTLGQTATVRFIGGQQREGHIRFIAPLGDSQTRTFRVEVEINNQHDPLPSGLSAEVVIELEPEMAHAISPALVRLDEQGRSGIFVIDADTDPARLKFNSIQVVRADHHALWVTGLPLLVQIVTLSQGTLNEGDEVRVQQTPAELLVPTACEDSCAP